ncbi:MAG TPA: CHAP domain-containing protein [Patescibacteria group bacterium]|nr:CHAP domain-containing protein [Patescibacteria group bacterium]
MAAQPLAKPTKLYNQVSDKLSRKTMRRRVIRFSLLAGNLLLVGATVAFIWGTPRSSDASAPSVLGNNANQAAAANPLDQLSSADIAVTVARLTNVPEATAVTNQAETENAQFAMAGASDTVASKPQVVATALKSRADIQNYVTVAGDSVASIAAKLGVSSDSIRWSNSLASNTVSVGAHLVVPPSGVNGIVYTVKAGDTADSLAQKYKSDAAKITAFNDAEIGGLKPGEQIVIPNGSVVTTVVAVSSSVAWGSGPIYGFNGYDYGYCTWYVANRISVPSNWGNASSWAYYAGMSGWTVSSTPIVGAIAQTPYAAGGLGHVAVVEAVSADGTQIKYSDMNGLAGWGRVGYSDWVSSSHFPHYIYH